MKHFSAFICGLLQNNNMKWGNSRFCGEREPTTVNFFTLYLYFISVPTNLVKGYFALTLQRERDGIIAKQFVARYLDTLLNSYRFPTFLGRLIYRRLVLLLGTVFSIINLHSVFLMIQMYYNQFAAHFQGSDTFCTTAQCKYDWSRSVLFQSYFLSVYTVIKL